MKTITVKSDGNGMVMEWNLEGSGRCEAGINNPFLEMCLKSFAEASSIDLKLICSKDIGGEELMGAMGDLFAEAVCKQCMELEEYGGTGSGIADDAFFPTSCKLMLPGRTDWVFEMVAHSMEEDSRSITKFFGNLSGRASLCLKFDTYDFSDRYCERVFYSFGRALKMAYSPARA